MRGTSKPRCAGLESSIRRRYPIVGDQPDPEQPVRALRQGQGLWRHAATKQSLTGQVVPSLGERVGLTFVTLSP